MRLRIRRWLRSLVVAAACAIPLFAQTPIPAHQPDTATYGTGELALFPRYADRAAYQTALGQQAPPYNPARPPKNWFDSTKSCDNGNGSYKHLGSTPDGLPAIVPFNISNCDAASVNLPGVYVYPAYTLPTSTVIVTCKTCPASLNAPLNPNLLATDAQAAALKAETGSTASITEVTTFGSFFYQNIDPNDKRKYLMLGDQNVGLLLLSKNQAGVGFPGKWTTDKDGNFSWVAAPVGPTGLGVNLAPEIVLPVRDLMANESFSQGILGIWQIARSDKTAPGPGVGGGFSDADRALLNQVLKILKQLTGQ